MSTEQPICACGDACPRALAAEQARDDYADRLGNVREQRNQARREATHWENQVKAAEQARDHWQSEYEDSLRVLKDHANRADTAEEARDQAQAERDAARRMYHALGAIGASLIRGL